METGVVSEDLAWWRAHRGTPEADTAAMRALLERLKAWMAQHDQDRAYHPPPFLRMAWDGVFADEHDAVEAAIAQIEEALGEG